MDKRFDGIQGIIFDYGGTIDTNSRHWAEVLWNKYEEYEHTLVFPRGAHLVGPYMAKVGETLFHSFNKSHIPFKNLIFPEEEIFITARQQPQSPPRRGLFIH